MFTPRRGDRPDKRNVCVVITDGQSYEPDQTAAAAQAVSQQFVSHLGSIELPSFTWTREYKQEVF